MRIRTRVLVALYVFACSFGLSQVPTEYGVSNDQRNASANCMDPLMASSAECAAAAQDQTEQTLNPSLNPNQGITSARARSLGAVPLEASSATGQSIAQRQLLPPDQPTEFQRFVAATTGQMLPLYGASLFRSVPTTFTPNDLGPATPEYVIGPDDELRVRLWGQINFTGDLRVDRSGAVYLPQVGSVQVGGLPFSEVDHQLRQAIGKIFRNFDLSVSVGRIRSIQIFVTGEARRPGAYTVSSLASLVDALFASGGPSPQGSLRHIQLNRDGKTVADLDLYAFLIYGDKSHDIRLLPEDVIYIPVAGPQVAIEGSIRNPAIYELSGAESIGTLLKDAGGPTAVASTARISLERVEDHKLRQAMEFGFEAGAMDTPLAEGDVLNIYPIVPAYDKTVTLRGNVANPGRFGWHPGMHLSELIPDRDSLMSRQYWWRRARLGLPAPEFEPALPDDQRLYISNQQLLTENQLLSSGNPRLPSAEDQRLNRQQASASESQAAVDSSGLDRNSRTNPAGASGSIAESRLQNTTGTVTSGGQLRQNDVRLLSPEIDWDYAVIERLDPDTLRTSLIPFDLGKLVLKHDAGQDLALQPGDTVTIFSQGDIRTPIEQQTKYVDLEGEFVHAGIYSAQPGETLRDLVQRAGGFTQKAYLYGSDFTRESTRRMQQQRLDEYVRTVSMETARGTQALAISGSSSANPNDVTASRLVSQDLIDRLSQVRATGRIVLQFKPSSDNLDEVPELSLENGDRFVVPSVPSTVNVVGAVYDQNSFVFRPGKTVGFYLHLAGGPNRDADFRHAFVIRADGSVISRSSVRNEWSVLGADAFDGIRLNPGDTVVVPDKTLRPTALRGVLDWTQVFSQLALGAAAINVLH